MQGNIQVQIKQPSGNRVEIDVNENETIGNLMIKVFKKTAFPVNKQILSYAGRKLESGNTLQQYYIEEGSTIHLTL